MILGVTLVALTAWIYLFLVRGMFWRARERDDDGAPDSAIAWPSVVAVVPARDEAECIARSLASLAAQDYPGAFRIVLVDDQSSDGTAESARSAAPGERLAIVRGGDRPAGWTGKLWALNQGARAAEEHAPEFLWFTDADIVHTPDNLRRLVARAQNANLVLASLMAKLHCESFAERLLIPAFVFFFQMLFPFAWVNDPKNETAAAAGGCVLVRRSALDAAGGLESIKSEIIDDCALARRLKPLGPIWLGLTDRAVSIRRYETIGAIRNMVARSAFAQLRYSPPMLIVTLVVMAVLYAAPMVALFTTVGASMIGATVWLMMMTLFQPMLYFYHRSSFWGLALPVIGILYALFTLDSAIQFWRGRGGQWKGRAQAIEA